MDDARYLYIVSSPHGGSTLLSLVLGNHPQAGNLGEVSFIPKLLALGELCTCGTVLRECGHWSNTFGELQRTTGHDMRRTPYKPYLGDALKGKDGSGLIDHQQQTRLRYLYGKMRGAVDTATLLATPRWLGMGATTLPSVRFSVRNTLALYAAAGEAHGQRLIIDASKLPRKAPHLYRADPDRVRILHLVRDGRGVVNSRKRYMPVARAAERWNHYHRLSAGILDSWVSPEHRLRLSYEDFVGDPPTALKAVFEWLDMDYMDACLEFGEDKVVHSAGGNPARFGLASGIKPADERWRTGLTPADLEAFEAEAGALNRQFGYE